jgi:hypothetical protein
MRHKISLSPAANGDEGIEKAKQEVMQSPLKPVKRLKPLDEARKELQRHLGGS